MRVRRDGRVRKPIMLTDGETLLLMQLVQLFLDKGTGSETNRKRAYSAFQRLTKDSAK